MAKVGVERSGTPGRKRPETPLDRLKLEIAAELGLAEKVHQAGWAELTAAESGRVGGYLHQQLRRRGLAIGPKGSIVPTGREAAPL